MDALERVNRIRLDGPPEPWDAPRIIKAAREGNKRWRALEGHYRLEWPMFADAVGVIDPSWQLPAGQEAAALAANVPRMRGVNSRIAIWFLKWERCPTTSGLPNPYEPWIEIWENGGAFSVEHGQFVDVFDAAGMPLRAIVVRRA